MILGNEIDEIYHVLRKSPAQSNELILLAVYEMTPFQSIFPIPYLKDFTNGKFSYFYVSTTLFKLP